MISLRRTLALSALSVLCAAAGCASSGTSGAQAGSGTANRTASRGSSNQLTGAELQASNSDNVFDALRKLRPQWMSSRGAVSVADPNMQQSTVDMYMNGSFGSIDDLRDIQVADINYVRYWDAGQASARYGMGHPRGVLEVVRK